MMLIKKIENFIKVFFSKVWVNTAIVLLSIWIIVNLLSALISFLGEGMFGKKKFWDIFVHLSALEFITFTAVGLIVAALAWLIKGIRKGLKEEKNKYEDKHSKRNR